MVPGSPAAAPPAIALQQALSLLKMLIPQRCPQDCWPAHVSYVFISGTIDGNSSL